jgi:hypothetical protein
MSDPIRLIDEEGSAAAPERELLHAGRSVGPTASEKQQLWTAIAARSAMVIPVSSAPTGSTSAAGGAGVSGAGIAALATKGALLALVVAGGAFTAAHVVRRPPSAPPAALVATPAAEPQGPPAPQPSLPSAPMPSSAKSASPGLRPAWARPVRTPTEHEAHARAPSPSQLEAEGLAVLNAKRALRAGDAATALRLLEEARRAFADGALGQEREALEIEALDRSGQSAAARARAAAFLRAYPTSPHATNVKRFAAER